MSDFRGRDYATALVVSRSIAKFTGTHAEKLAKTGELVDEICAKIEKFCEEYCELELQS